MFTGLIQHVGRVAANEPGAFGATLSVDVADWDHHPALGDSISVNGCCLTVAALGDSKGLSSASTSRASTWSFEIVRQTLEVTTLGRMHAGDHVNLEHSATPTTLLGGHLVQGHIDALGLIEEVISDASQSRLKISVPRDAMRLVVDKGSMTVDGVSLTVAAVSPSSDRSCWFDVALIPTTIRKTTLGRLRRGDRVNLETDCIVRAVASVVERLRADERGA